MQPDPELWAFLESLRPGQILAGRVAALEQFGVFVALDDGPAHPVFPGVGFITYPELSWRRFEAASDVVAVGQRVSCEFLQFDTYNGEARLSLCATAPDPFRDLPVGRALRGRVTKLTPFGVFIEVAPGIEGLLPLADPADAHLVGDEVTVAIAEVDLARHRVRLSR
ncbi:MAG TPA: S1 RNA-binding domain-containing protein [Pseudonocardiaceae bacterium]